MILVNYGQNLVTKRKSNTFKHNFITELDIMYHFKFVLTFRKPLFEIWQHSLEVDVHTLSRSARAAVSFCRAVRVAAGTLLKAASVGARTVNMPAVR